ncbi:unnamed protein product [Cunninghamella blakesleeana]
MVYSVLLPRDPSQEDGIEAGGCKLMDSFAVFIQLCLATIAFSTLIIKRHGKNPNDLYVYSSIFIHSLNVIAAYFFGVKTEGELSNPYFLNILVDCTLGVGILWLILQGFKYLTISVLQWTGFQSGVYGDPPLKEQIKPWLKQLSVYTLSLMIMKVLVVIIFHLCPWLEDFGNWVLGWTSGNYKLQVAFVMLVFPLIMNILQFWIIDNIVKHHDKNPIRLRHPYGDDDDVENLLSTMENDDDEHHQRDQSLDVGVSINIGEEGSLRRSVGQNKPRVEDQTPLLNNSLHQENDFHNDKGSTDHHHNFAPISTSLNNDENNYELGSKNSNANNS